MKITPKLKTSRFAQLELGDLCIYPHEDGQFIALVSALQVTPKEKRLVVLGPVMPYQADCSMVIDLPNATAITFKREYEVKISPSPCNWVTEAPNRETNCFVLVDEKIYFRTYTSPRLGNYQSWYVDLSTGFIQNALNGHSAYATKWQIVTNENEPRIILNYPE